MAFLQNINAPELILIFLIVLLLFGAKRLPELFKSLGQSVKEFKKATSNIEDDIRNAMDAEDEPRKPKPVAESKPAEPATPVTPAAEEAPRKTDNA